MIKVCPTCSNVDVDKLEKMVSGDKLEVGCIGECGQHEGKSFGYINDELVIKETEADFMAAVKASK